MTDRVSLTKTGPELSPLVWGSWRCIEQFDSADDFARFLEALLDLGVTSIDTADIYGGYKVEAFLGEALRKLGDKARQFEVVTKCGIALTMRSENRLKHYDSSPSYIARAVEDSLTMLNVERIDCLLIHRPDDLMHATDTAEAIDTLIKQGKIASFGVSNFRPDQLDLLNNCLSKKIVTNQVEFSPLCLDPLDDGTLNQAQMQGFRPMAWSPLAGGRLFESEEPQAIRVRNSLQRIAASQGYAGLSEATLAFVMAHPSAPLPVLGTGRPDRVEAALKAVDIPMERQNWYAILEASRGHPVP